MSIERRWQAWLDQVRAEGRHRRLAAPAGADFSSNDYLGYGRRTFAETAGLARSGTASRLLRGHVPLWDEVETALARWHHGVPFDGIPRVATFWRGAGATSSVFEVDGAGRLVAEDHGLAPVPYLPIDATTSTSPSLSVG